MTTLTKEAVAPLGVKPRDAERSKNFFALGPHLVDVLRARPSRRSSGSSSAFAKNPLVLERQPGRLPAPASTSARPPSCSTIRFEVKPAKLDPGRVHQHQRQHRPGLGPGRRQPAGRAAALPRLLPDHAGVRHPPRAVEAQELRRAHAPGRRRDRRHRRGPRCRLRRPPRRHHHQRPRPGAEERDHRPRRQPRAAAAHHRHPAGRAVAPACRPRPRQPTCCMAMYGRHGESPLPIVAAYSPSHCFDVGHRGGAHRPRSTARRSSCCPTATSPTAPSRGCCPTSTRCPTSASQFATEPNHDDDDGTRVLALPPRSRDAGPPVGRARARPASSTASAASRRRTAPATSPTTRRTTSTMVRTAGRQDRRHRQGHPRRQRRPATPDADLLVLGWGSTWGAIDAAVDRCAPTGRKVARVPPRAPQPVPANLGEVLRRYPKVLVPEMNLGQLSPPRAGRVPGRRPSADRRCRACRSPPRGRDRHPRPSSVSSDMLERSP